MLDPDTKRRINTCRDILVGKVPDPKSQVEQITIALIYKFMDDMDLEAEEMGFERKFFTGEFERYRWSKLVGPGVSGQEMLNLYSEALAKMVENPDLPELFRAIFRNAFLPYRDPETLRSFLREIDGFTYDHSERLGDAFEYLLSVLGSQGDAGQFRTPRHIIDFMVEVLEPKKDEVILDPACGTAGFLISSYKHILKANTTTPRGNGNGESSADVDAAEATLDSPLRYSGDLLSTDDRLRLANNIRGYDISPDMVRLSLVNLYLHGFLDPKVEEYDTLSSDDKWGDTADVILANPPFMSPKGGIRPHNRFQVQSKRSEVLFVDYIAEHLNPNGRAAIVVPEGIIFQGQSAYVELRKMLLDKFLAAVISLPAGVFNPYSGVKTSILILDRAVAKNSDSIAFFKVENDGFGLGAQRRAIKGSQLPEVRAELREWLVSARNGAARLESPLGFAVEKALIAEGGEFNLSGERYRDKEARTSRFPLVPLAELLDVQNGYAFKSEQFGSEGTPIIRIRDIKPNRTETKYAGDYDPAFLVQDGDLLVGMDGEFNSVIWAGGQALLNQRVCRLHSFRGVLKEYVARLLPIKLKEIENTTYAVTVKHISAKQIRGIEIPLPPLEVQREIVGEIDTYQAVINGARAVLGSYRPHIPVELDWPLVAVSEISRIARGASPRPIERYLTSEPGGQNWIKIGDVAEGAKYITSTKDKVTNEGAAKSRKVSPGDLILSNSMSFGRPYISKIDGFIHDGWLLISPDLTKVSVDYLYYALGSKSTYEQFKRLATGGVVNNLNSSLVGGVKIALPPLDTQQYIVAEFDAERELVDANHQLIARFEAKIDASIERLWAHVDEAGSA